MIDDIKWRFDEVKSEGCSAITNEGGYSPELTKAIILRDDLEEYFIKQGS
jgi:hypothetical protein